MMQTDSIPHQVADSAHSHPASVVHVRNAASANDDSARQGASPVPSAPKVSGVAPPFVAHADSVAADSVAADTVAAAPKGFGICLTAPPTLVAQPRADDSLGMSCVVGVLALLFCIIGLRFRNNGKYITAMLRNMVEVRLRGNVFDETVSETSFLVLLNLLWSCSGGIVLWTVLGYTLPGGAGLPQLHAYPSATIGICMGVGVAYTCIMALAYVTVGTVFYDSVHGRMWLKGFAAGIGLLGLIWLPLSLLLLFYPQWTEILLYIALATFILAKIVFIWKGFRIFFTQISSWVLFLYYLCSLEIVPLILTYLAALQLCSLL